jgi:N6-L-threonylcarbamoyladenine synthase
MIAWTGILAYNSGIRTPIEESHVNPSWRMDQVEVPWRSS